MPKPSAENNFTGRKIGEQPQLLTQRQQRPLGTNRIIEAVPLGAAHGAEQDRVALLGQIQNRIGERLAVGVDGRAADDAVFQLDRRSRKALRPV